MASTNTASPTITNVYGFTGITTQTGFYTQNASGFTVVQFGYNLTPTLPAGPGSIKCGFQVTCPITLPGAGNFTAENQVGGSAVIRYREPGRVLGMDALVTGCIQAQNGTNRISIDFASVPKASGTYDISLNLSIFASV